jgi:hypothetical protein
MRTSNALDLEAGVFTQRSPHAIAQSLKRSADRSRRRKSAPFRSAMSMLNFHINRAGKGLSESQKDVLERAKDELRKLYGRDPAVGGRARKNDKTTRTSRPRPTRGKRTARATRPRG